MTGFWVIVGSLAVYQMVVSERCISWITAKKYQKEKSKSKFLKKELKREKNHNRKN